jgi:site-specific recombinase XerD
VTPAFVEGEGQKLLNGVETFTPSGLRDRAPLATLAYTFARIGSVVNLKVEDYYPSGKRFLLRFKEKGGKEKELAVHHKLEEILDQYLKVSGLEKEPGSPLFPTSIGKTGKLSRRPLVRTDDGFINSYASQQVQLGIAAWTRRFHSLSDDPCWKDRFDVAESWEQVDQSSTLSGPHRSYCV